MIELQLSIIPASTLVGGTFEGVHHLPIETSIVRGQSFALLFGGTTVELSFDEELTASFSKRSACDRGMSRVLRFRKIPKLSTTDADNVEVWALTINGGRTRQFLNVGSKFTEIASRQITKLLGQSQRRDTKFDTRNGK